MAHYVCTVRTTRSPDDVFAYLADLRNFAEWDPGVTQVVQVEGEGGGPDTVYDVTVASPGPDLTLRYRTVEYGPSHNLLVVAKSRSFTSTDRITIHVDGDDTVVTYDADLQLNGVLRVGEPGLRLAFKRIGDRAAAGLRRALGG